MMEEIILLKLCNDCENKLDTNTYEKKYCESCKEKRIKESKDKWYRNYYQRKTVPLDESAKWMLKLLKKQSATIETLSYYIKKNHRKTRELITHLRFKGYNISLSGYGGLYELVKVDCPLCHKKFDGINNLRNHHGHKHK